MPRPEFTKFSPAVRDKALALAKEIGVNKAAAKLKISRSKLTTWRQASGDARPRPGARTGTEARAMPQVTPNYPPSLNGARRNYSAEEKARILDIASRIGVEGAATETGVASGRIYQWKRSLRKPTVLAPLWLEGFRAGFKEGFALGKES